MDTPITVEVASQDITVQIAPEPVEESSEESSEDSPRIVGYSATEYESEIEYNPPKRGGCCNYPIVSSTTANCLLIVNILFPGIAYWME